MGPTHDAAGNLEELAKVLAAACNLSQLQINGVHCIGSRLFETIFTGCRFPKLNSLDLSYISFTEKQLVGLLGSSPGLQTLALYQIWLRQGLWERVAHWIKQCLQLHSVYFEALLDSAFERDDIDRIMSEQDLAEDVSI